MAILLAYIISMADSKRIIHEILTVEGWDSRITLLDKNQ